MLPHQHHHWIRLAIAHTAVAVFLAGSSFVLAPAHFDLLAPIAHGQSLLLAVWLPFSSIGLVRRSAIYFSLGTSISAVGLNCPRWMPHFSQTLIVAASDTIMILLFVSLPTLILRLLGWRLIDAPNKSAENAPWQFSISTMFAVTLLVSMLLTLQQLVWSMGIRNNDGSIGFPSTMPVAANVAVIVGGGLGQGWAVLSAVVSCLAVQGHRSRLVATLIIVALICAFPMHVRGGTAHLNWVRTFATSMATVILSLLYLRHQSMRITSSASHTKLAAEPRVAAEP